VGWSAMRGKPQAEPEFLTVINLNAVVPQGHPLRAIKRSGCSAGETASN